MQATTFSTYCSNKNIQTNYTNVYCWARHEVMNLHVIGPRRQKKNTAHNHRCASRNEVFRKQDTL